MRVLGLDLPVLGDASRDAATQPAGTLVLLDGDGKVAEWRRADSLPDVVAAVGALCGDDPFLLGVNIPTVVPQKAVKARPVESVVRRRLGFRLQPGGRAALSAAPGGVVVEALIAGLAAAGQPCLPYPDRDRRRPGLAEAHPGLTLKALLWQASPLPAARGGADLPALFRAYGAGEYRLAGMPARTAWTDQVVALDRVLCALRDVPGFDTAPARLAQGKAATSEQAEAAAALLDAALIAGTARRYLETPEDSLFVGDHESGYVILPADGFIRRLTSDARPSHGRLFPRTSLRQRLGPGVKLRAADLLSLPGKPQRMEATFSAPPAYEFENLDEMLWWKHTRHVEGAIVPTEGLSDLVVSLEGAGADGANGTLKLVRSRHRTLSFRFEPPAVWRTHVPTRDGKTYGFRILRATYEILPGDDDP